MQKLYDMANNSPEVTQLRAFQEIMNLFYLTALFERQILRPTKKPESVYGRKKCL
jgi:hypothetical protein